MSDPRSLAAAALAELIAGEGIGMDEEEEEEEANEEYVDEDEDDDADFMDEDYDAQDAGEDRWYPGHRTVFTFPPAASPQAAGVALVKSGEFGRIEPKIKARKDSRNLATVLGSRLLRPHPALYKENYASVGYFSSTIPIITHWTPEPGSQLQWSNSGQLRRKHLLCTILQG